ncbi:MAG: hypothetical protein CSB49_06045 [Proteobacteria bacterium]|nr:MAG: hypothetical protein CSB49_06045 [Pseudomonadota bacterium]
MLPPPLPRWLVHGALGLAVLAQLIPALGILGGAPIYGDDHSSHVAAIRQLIELLGRGETDFFCPSFNLGFPMYLYYQPLPHLVVALLSIASFGLLDAQGAFNVVVAGLWCAYPLAVHRGLSQLELDELAVLIAAVVAPLCASTLTFGFTLHSVMALGLYTQTWAMVLAPLALGACWRATRPDADARALVSGAAWLLALCLSHAFYGLVLGTAMAIGLLCSPQPRLLWQSGKRLVALGLIVAASLTYWLLPLVQTRDFAGGWPWGGLDRWQGYGVARVAEVLFTGQLFDQGQLPAISLGLLLGLGAIIWRWRERSAKRMLTLSFVVFLAFLIGRRSLGHWVDIQPANLGLQLFRYIGAVHLFGVALAGVGLAALARVVRHRVGPWPAAAAIAALLLSPLCAQQVRAFGLFRTISAYAKANELELRKLGAAIDADAAKTGIKEVEGPAGRVYAHNKVGTGTHFIAALLAHYTRQPLGQSYGVGMHDSLGFYYLEHLQPTDDVLFELYGFRWVVVERGPKSFPTNPEPKRAKQLKVGPRLARGRKLKVGPRLARSRKLALHRRRPTPADTGSRRGLWRVAEARFALMGAPRRLRPAVKSWLRSPLPARGGFGVIVPRGREPANALAKLPRLRMLGATNAVERRDRGRWKQTRRLWVGLSPTSEAPGRLLPVADPTPGGRPTSGLRYQARVELTRPGLLVLAVGYHPFWQVEVDGERARVQHVTPAFVGVMLPAGAHRVRFSFVNPYYQKTLFLTTVTAWLLALMVLGVTGRQQRHRGDA